MSDNALTVARSCHLGELSLTFKISSFQGTRHRQPLSQLDAAQKLAGVQLPGLSDLYVVCQLWSDSCPLTPPYRTAHKAFTSTYTWNEAFALPIKYRELPLNAQLTFTVYDSRGPPAATSPVPVGGTTLKLFGKKCTLKRGKQRLYLWKDVEADGAAQTTTPSKFQTGEADELGRLEKVGSAAALPFAPQMLGPTAREEAPVGRHPASGLAGQACLSPD
jgi:phosphatidylinositol 3-kinase